DIVATIHDGANARIVYFRNTGTNDAPIWTYVSNFFVTYSTLVSDQLYSHATVTMGDMDGDYDDDMIICDAGIDPDTGWIITVRYFERTGSLYWTERTDWIPGIQSLANNFDWTPRIAIVDNDKDGDKDFTVSLDKLYYFEQTGYSGSFGFFTSRDDSYYDEINAARKNETVFGRVAFWDFDLDNDLDIIVPHATENYTGSGYKCETGRFTYWKNTGTYLEPEWTKDRSMFEPDFTGTLLNPERGYDYPQFRDLDGDGLLDLICMNEDNIRLFTATLDHDSFLCATYPYVHMVEVDKRLQSNGYWGYEAYDSWYNWLLTLYWSRALEYGDLDGDGIPEVFVGSFDNNIIAFEQVANNTYRRSWRSPDFFIQPYGFPEPWPIQTNIRDMIIGDQDNDGKEEIIVTAGYKVYVFEVVEDDYYEMVWSSFTQYWEDYGGTKVGEWLGLIPRVLGVHKDLDGDGLPEIIVGCDDFLVYFENVADNEWQQVAYLEFTAHEAGEPYIRGISTGDMDRDGIDDVVIVGTDDMYTGGYITYSYGWVRYITTGFYANGTLMDNTYLEFDYTEPNSGAYCIDVGDHDGDMTPEAYVGCGTSINIYEFKDGINYLVRVLPTQNVTDAIRVGNTDGDSWFEIVAGVGKNISVFEQNQTYARELHMYDQVWTSGEMHEAITDIRLGDSNRNGRMEIIATAIQGYLYAFEWVVNSSAIPVTPSPALAFNLASVGQMQLPIMAIMPNYYWHERLRDTLPDKTWRYCVI
ncbi:MAG: FG-GAP repeat domain-containing protein, partial [Candidatus Thorarchaeota archaeon]